MTRHDIEEFALDCHNRKESLLITDIDTKEWLAEVASPDYLVCLNLNIPSVRKLMKEINEKEANG